MRSTSKDSYWREMVFIDLVFAVHENIPREPFSKCVSTVGLLPRQHSRHTLYTSHVSHLHSTCGEMCLKWFVDM